MSIDKLAYEKTIYLQVSFPPESKKDWPKNYRITREVGEISIDKNGKLGKGKLEDEKELVELIEKKYWQKNLNLRLFTKFQYYYILNV